MRSKFYLYTVLISVIFFACKKKDASSTNTNSPTGSTNNTGLTQSTGGDLCDLQTTYRYINVNGLITKDSMIFAVFYSAAVTSVQPSYMNAGNVALNGVNIPYINPYYYISSNSPVNLSVPLTWSVSGSGTITAFSQTIVPSYPKYTGGTSLPDTCLKANGITINITGVTNNLSSVAVSLYSGSASATKYIVGSSGTIIFTPADINQFSANSSLTIIVNMSNVYSATLGGIKRGFSNNLQYTKYSYLK